MDRDTRIKWDVFQGKSTYLDDYRWNKNQRKLSSTFPSASVEPTEKQSAEYVPVDTETFTPWKKDAHIPFNLYHVPKDVIGTHPKDIIKMPEPIFDNDMELAIKTRPRIYMKSAVSMDDIPDPVMRKFVCQAVYTTDARFAEKEATGSFELRPPPSELIVGRNPSFNINIEAFASLEKEWLDKAKDWDSMQVRMLTNADKMFWNNTQLPARDGSPLTNLVSESKKAEIKKLIEEDMLRLPHDYPKPLYDGYRPILSYGIPLRKKVEAITHPFISTAQAITKRYEKD